MGEKEKETFRLGEFVTLKRGYDLPTQARSDGVYPIVSSSGVSGSHGAFKVEGPGVVTGRYGTLGEVFYVSGRFWPLNTSLYVQDFKGNDPKFVYYYLQTVLSANFNAAGAVPGVNRNILHKLAVPKPPMAQQKIAAVLSAYDDLIENNKRRIALLEKMAEEIYREWFVRLRFPGHAKMEFVKGVPEGWERKKFGEYCMLKRGYDLPDSQVEQGTYPVIASTSIKAYHNQFKVKPPVITTGRSGSLGEVLFTNTKAWPLNTTLYVREFFDNSPFLIYYTLKNMKLENFNAGVGVPTLNRNHLNGMDMIVPEKELQGKFEELVSKLYSQKEQISDANRVLTRIRDSLLGRLISGKLSVEDLDIRFPPSMRRDTTAD